MPVRRTAAGFAAPDLHHQGWTFTRIAKLHGCTRMTVAKHLWALVASPRRARRSAEERRMWGIWNSMVQACSNARHPSFRHYGGRGISVANAWARFDGFAEWAGRTRYRRGQSLNRIDEDGDFSPANCSWGARRRDRTAARLRAFGVEKTIAQWARDAHCKVTEASLRYRLQQGVPPEIAIAGPKKTGHPRFREQQSRRSRSGSTPRRTGSKSFGYGNEG